MLVLVLDRRADGVHFQHCTETDIARRAFFENAGYALAPITVNATS
jgi:hypothetical protein